jgi:8-oxo-dGTP pyrophosphatase MutT (NUDIX family)
MIDEETQPRQAAAIPIRRGDDSSVQVCLIRRIGSKRWGIPKGYIERGDDWRAAALTEALEEAGLGGRVVGESIGTYEYNKGPLTLAVAVCVIEVVDERAAWHEMRWRERRWYSIEAAGALLREHPVWPLFESIQSRLAAMTAEVPHRPTTPGGDR